MPKKVKTKIIIEYEGFPKDQFGKNKDRNDEYWPSVFLQSLMGQAAEHFEDISVNFRKCVMKIRGYKVTVKIKGREK